MLALIIPYRLLLLSSPYHDFLIVSVQANFSRRTTVLCLILSVQPPKIRGTGQSHTMFIKYTTRENIPKQQGFSSREVHF